MIKLGFINYLNSIPLFHDLMSEDIDISMGNPVETALGLKSGMLDAGQLSLAEYLDNKKNFVLLNDFCISTQTGKVDSVLLLSKQPIEQLNGKTIYYFNQSRTGAALLKVLLKERFHLDCEKKITEATQEDLKNEKFENLMIIGDLALWAIKNKKNGLLRNYHFYDLAEEWFKWKGLPFVFAVFVHQKDLKEDFHQIHMLMSRQLQSNLKDLKQIIHKYKTKDFNTEFLSDYFAKLNYQLDEEKLKSIGEFEKHYSSLE
jgi:chorismate dehydratase